MTIKDFFDRYCVAIKNQDVFVTNSEKGCAFTIEADRLKDSLRSGSPLANKELFYWTIEPSTCTLMVCYSVPKNPSRIYDTILERFLERDDRDYLRDSLGEDADGIDWNYGIGEITDELILNSVDLPPNMEYRTHDKD